MTQTAEPAERLVANIKRDLESFSTTTPQTLNLLRAILGIEHEEQVAETPKIGKSSSKKKSSVISKPPARPVRGKREKDVPAFDIFESRECATKPLQGKIRQKFATETFNNTLKILSTAAKAEQSSLVSQEAKAVAQNKPSEIKPLHESSPNKQRKADRNKPSKCIEQDLSAMADCALTSLDCLRQIHAQEGSQQEDTSLEKGGLILLDKTITLRLPEQALQQLRRIHEQYWKRRGHTQQSTNSKTKATGMAPFLYGGLAIDKATFTYTTSFQSQALRLAVLMAPLHIDQDFLMAIQPDSEGSPTWIVNDGVKLGYLDQETAGLQLRTIALAISKIYSIAIESSPVVTKPDVALGLLDTALRIKCQSWKLLSHQPDLDRECWSHFNRGIKRFCNTQKRNSKSIMLSNEYAQNLQSALKACGYDESLPSELTQYLGLQNEKDREEYKVSKSTSPSIATARHPGVHQLIDCCKKATMALDKLTDDINCAILISEQTIDAFRIHLKGTRSQFEELLLHGAQLRKSASKVVLSTEKYLTAHESNEQYSKLQTNALRLMNCFIDFLLRSLNSEEHLNKEDRENRRNALLTTIAKSIEAVFSAQKCLIGRSPSYSQELSIAIRRCLELSDLAQNSLCKDEKDNAITSYLRSLPVRSSQLFWSHYLYAVEKRLPQQFWIEMLEYSIAMVESRSLDEQQKSFVALKYEKLAACFEEISKPGNAALMLKSAIKMEIRQGALDEAVALVLSRPYKAVWVHRDSKVFTLGRNLARLVQLQLSLNVLDNQLPLYDDTSLQPIQRAVMLGRQIEKLSEHNLNSLQKRSFGELVKLVLGLCNQSEYQIYRLSFLSQLLAWTARKQICSVGDYQIFQKLHNMYNEEKSCAKLIHLQQFEPTISAIIMSQFAFCLEVVNEQVVGQCVDKLHENVQLCSTSTELDEKIHDCDLCVAQLRLLADYAGMVGLTKVRLIALQTVQHILELEHSPRVQILVNCLIDVGTLHHRFQDTMSSGKSFARVEKLLPQIADDHYTFLEWSVAYGEYLLNVNNVSKCSEVLGTAQKIFEHTLEMNEPLSARSRIRRDTVVCRASLLASKLAFHHGDLSEATVQARRSVKLSTVIWSLVEKSLQSACADDSMAEGDSGLNALTDGIENLNISCNSDTSRNTQKGVHYWTQISLHCSILQHMAYISAHLGLYQDAVHYLKQASTIAEKTSVWTTTRSELALLYAKGGDLENALSLTPKQVETFNPQRPYTDSATCAINWAETFVLLGDIDISQSFYKLAKTSVDSGKSNTGAKCSNEIAHQTSRTTSSKPTRNVARKAPTSKAKIDNKISKAKCTTVKTLPIKAVDNGFLTMEEIIIKERISVLEDHMRLVQNESGESMPAQLNIPDLIAEDWTSRKCLAQALVMMQAALDIYSNDAVKGVLTETAIALPVRYRQTGKREKISFIQSNSPIKPSQGLSRKKSSQVMLPNGDDLLSAAHKLLCFLINGRNDQSSSDTLHVLYKTLSQLALLSTGMSKPFGYSSLQLVLQSLIPKDEVRKREHFSVLAEEASSSRQQVEQWPITAAIQNSQVKDQEQDLLHLTANLPQSWTVISIALNAEQKELLISKTMTGQSPFLMKLPLARQNNDGNESEQFTFDDAKSELLEIIQKANSTAHDRRGRGDKQTRKTWYAEREELDQRLEALLTNMENIWFGGFRGLLSPERVDESLLTRFGKALSQSLDLHLPSRQKSAKSMSQKVELHAHVLELFTSLSISEEVELEDAIIDLLYFVVDILQFNGEQNAYDEIDFDAILVDVLDAVKVYHESKEREMNQQDSKHIILVLDKELQSFPWESMPCLKTCSVSRMPSLGAIQERLDMMRSQNGDSQCYSIPRTTGAYMLNPSSDLLSTQETFAATFQSQLQGFSSIINHTPTEQEFESCLNDNDLFIYMGHGSGAQYIRGRTIRKMEKCAVTLLMGCSSAKLTECGVYESFGPPWHYMHAGSPAVLGTLWDVTDRDIDRFAMTMLCEWGLLEKDVTTEKAMSKSSNKGKGKTKSPNGSANENDLVLNDRGVIAMDDAVCKARDSCSLRYLNGAAPIIYGIPVVLV